MRQAPPASAGQGRFVVFEGGEGTGKSTQARLLATRLTAGGLPVVATREPGGAPGAEVLRRLLVEEPPAGGWEPLSEALLHYAARNEHLCKTVAPALGRGAWVVCDRFADSTTAYQGAGLALPPVALESLRRLVLADFRPDLVLVLDLPAEEGLARAAARSGGTDRYESQDIGFHRRVRAAFRAIAEADPARYAMIDAALDPAAVHEAVCSAVRTRLDVALPV